MQDGGNSYLPAYDALGNVHGMIKASDGSLAAAYEYDAFGQTLRESGAYAASNPFRFATKYADGETGLIYHETRYYSPSLGRFINRDTISEQGGLNLYAYCSNNGVNRWDYLGMTETREIWEPGSSDSDYYGQLHPELTQLGTGSWYDAAKDIIYAWMGYRNEGTNPYADEIGIPLSPNSIPLSAQIDFAWSQVDRFNEWATARGSGGQTVTLGPTIDTGTGKEITPAQKPVQVGVDPNNTPGNPNVQPTVDSSPGLLTRVWNALTGWHFEGRTARNGMPPTYDQVMSQKSPWVRLGGDQAIYHDNGVGQPEHKYIHPSGREVVFDGDTLRPITDPRYAGTYNYVNPAPKPENWYNVGGWLSFAGRGVGHVVTDVVPYWMGGNVRGNDPPPDPSKPPGT